MMAAVSVVDIKLVARRTIQLEAEAIAALQTMVNDDFQPHNLEHYHPIHHPMAQAALD